MASFAARRLGLSAMFLCLLFLFSLQHVAHAEKESPADSAAAPEQRAEGEGHHADNAHNAHKVHKQEKLRKEYREERRKLVEELDETQRMRNTICLVLAFIVVLSLLFEFSAHHLLLTKDRYLRPILHVVFKELTVLGFISLLVFVVAQTGYPQKLSKDIFGTPSELIHLFHHVHFLMFFIMAAYIGLVMMTLQRTRGEARSWEKFEEAIRGSVLARDLNNLQFSHGWTTLGAAAQAKDAHRMDKYKRLRHGFLHPCTPTRHHVDELFDFSAYLSISLADTFSQIVEIAPPTWAFVMTLLLGGRLYMTIPNEIVKFVLFILIGWTLVGVTLVIQSKLRAILWMLTGYRKPDSWDWPLRLMGAGLLGVPTEMTSPDTELDEEARAPESAPYLQATSDVYQNFKGQDKIPNKHELLFWFNSKGPAILLQSIQSLLFIMAVYLGLVMFRFSSDVGEFDGVGLVLMLAPPLVVCFVAVPDMIINFVLVTSLEMLRRRDTIALVTRERNDRVVAIRIAATKVAKSVAATVHRRWRKTLSSTPVVVKSARRAELLHLFRLYDEDNSGTLDRQELQFLFLSLGLQSSVSETNSILMLLGDQVSQEDFVRFMNTYEASGFNPEKMSDTDVDTLFRIMDINHKGKVKSADFVTYLRKHDATLDEESLKLWVHKYVQGPDIAHGTFRHLFGLPAAPEPSSAPPSSAEGSGASRRVVTGMSSDTFAETNFSQLLKTIRAGAKEAALSPSPVAPRSAPLATPPAPTPPDDSEQTESPQDTQRESTTATI